MKHTLMRCGLVAYSTEGPADEAAQGITKEELEAFAKSMSNPKTPVSLDLDNIVKLAIVGLFIWVWDTNTTVKDNQRDVAAIYKDIEKLDKSINEGFARIRADMEKFSTQFSEFSKVERFTELDNTRADNIILDHVQRNAASFKAIKESHALLKNRVNTIEHEQKMRGVLLKDQLSSRKQ